jgi:hypothetical protein
MKLVYDVNGLSILNSEQITFVQQDLMIAQADFNALSLCNARFKELFQSLFKITKQVTNQADALYLNEMFNFCWLLFLVSKEKLVPPSHLTNKNVAMVLACCLHFLYNHIPDQLKFDTKSMVESSQRNESNQTTTLQFISCRLDINHDELSKQEPFFVGHLNEVVYKILVTERHT